MPAAPQSFATKSQEPVYALAFASPDTLIYAGGGGQSKSGIANAIVCTGGRKTVIDLYIARLEI